MSATTTTGRVPASLSGWTWRRGRWSLLLRSAKSVFCGRSASTWVYSSWCDISSADITHLSRVCWDEAFLRECVCVFGGVWHDCSCDDATKLLRARAQRSRNVTSSRWKSIAIEVCAVLEWKVDWNYQKWTDLRMINGGINFEFFFIRFNLIQFSLIDEKSCYNLIIWIEKCERSFRVPFKWDIFGRYVFNPQRSKSASRRDST